MARWLRWIVLLAAFVPGPAGAKVPLALALAKTYLENPRLQAARARLRAIDESVPIARAGRRPRLQARTSATLRQLDRGSGVQTQRTLRQSLTFEQQLYDGGETSARIAGAEFEVRAERARLERLEQEVLLEAVGAFTAVIRDQRVLELALANEQRLQQYLLAVKDRYRFGQVTRTDVAQAETRYAAAVAERQRATGRLRASGASYRRVIGDPPGALAMPELPAGLPGDLATATAAIDEHPEVVAARMALESAERGLAEARALLRPKLALSGTLAYASDPGLDSAHDSEAAIGASLTVPLYQGGGAYARMRQSRQQVTARRYALEDARRRVREAITAAFEGLRTARGRMDSLATRLTAAKLALEGVREEARTGARTVLDVLDAEQELFAAQTARADAERELVLAGYRLLAAAGRLTARELGLDVAVYDEKAYYREVRSAWFGREPPSPARRRPPNENRKAD
jgi:type I secretion outer membrane protein, TolC family